MRGLHRRTAAVVATVTTSTAMAASGAAAIMAPAAHAMPERPEPAVRVSEPVVHAAAQAYRARAAARTAARVITVRSGDTLWSLAGRYLGAAGKWPGMYVANRGIIGPDPNIIMPGQRLRLATAPSFGGSAPVAVPGRDGDDGSPSPVSVAGTIAPSGLRAAAGYAQPSGSCYDPSGHLSDAQVAMVWECAGGPAWAAGQAVIVTECESGHDTGAYNPSGASGLFQILGQVVPGNLFDAHINALNAVSKWRASGGTWAQWACPA